MDGIKIGTVETVTGKRAKVRFRGQETVQELTVLKTGQTRYVPQVGEKVVCLLLPGGHGHGFVVGGI